MSSHARSLTPRRSFCGTMAPFRTKVAVALMFAVAAVCTFVYGMIFRPTHLQPTVSKILITSQLAKHSIHTRPAPRTTHPAAETASRTRRPVDVNTTSTTPSPVRIVIVNRTTNETASRTRRPVDVSASASKVQSSTRPNGCIVVASTWKGAPADAVTVVPVSPVVMNSTLHGIIEHHASFVAQFDGYEHKRHHIVFVWRHLVDKARGEKRKKAMISFFRHAGQYVMNEVGQRNVRMTVLGCTHVTEEGIRADMSSALGAYISSEPKTIVVAPPDTRFVYHAVYGKVGRYENNGVCVNILRRKEEHQCDCSWAKNARACKYDGSKCFKTCCCQYFDPTGVGRLARSFDYDDKIPRPEREIKVHAIGGFVVGQGRKTGLSCFSNIRSRGNRLVRAYREEVSAGGPSQYDGNYGVCDLVELPVAVRPGILARDTIAWVVSAAWAGNGHLTADKARAVLANSYLGGQKGAFGFSPYFTSVRDTFQGDRHVSWGRSSYQGWRDDSVCLRSEHATLRPVLLYNMTKIFVDISRTQKKLTVNQSPPFGRYGSLLTPMKTGSIPPWEFDMDMDLIIDTFMNSMSAEQMKRACSIVMEMAQERATKLGLSSTYYCGEQGLPSSRNRVKCELSVRTKEVDKIYFPHWVNFCDDLKPCPKCYVLTPDIWEKCLKRMQNMTKRGVMKGQHRDKGVKFEIQCRADNKMRRQIESSMPPVQLAVANPSDDADALFLAIENQYSVVLSETDSLDEYGNILPNPWDCPWWE